MKTVQEYLDHATRAEELSAQTDAPAHRAQIQKIAEMWRDLAKLRATLLKSSS